MICNSVTVELPEFIPWKLCDKQGSLQMPEMGLSCKNPVSNKRLRCLNHLCSILHSCSELETLSAILLLYQEGNVHPEEVISNLADFPITVLLKEFTLLSSYHGLHEITHFFHELVVGIVLDSWLHSWCWLHGRSHSRLFCPTGLQSLCLTLGISLDT